MSSILGEIGLSEQLLVSFALGTAASPALAPYVRTLVNDAWASHPVLPPTIYTTIRGVAEGKVDEKRARQWAHEQGFGDDAFDSLLAASKDAAAFGDLMNGWRRGLIDKSGFELGLKRLGVESQWWPMLEGLKREHLSPAEAANARQQLFISDDEQRAIAALYGITPDDADVQFKLAGLPPGVETALDLLRRKIIGEDRFRQIVAEGHTKTKYTDDLLELERRVLSAAVYTRAFLKGHISRAQMHAGGELTGYTPDDLDLWELTEGRPATVHEIHIGYARGGSLPGATDELDAIATAVRQSDIRPEYTELLQKGRFTYPSPFVLRGLAQAGDLGGEAEVEQVLIEVGWKPSFARQVARAWTSSATAAGDTHRSKAETQLWNTVHRSYVAEEIDDATATAALESAGVAAASIPAVLRLWGVERNLVRKQLSPAKIVKALKSGAINAATGQPWTEPEALAALTARGYSPTEAQDLVNIG